MSHAPVCVPCRTTMHPERIGTPFIEYSGSEPSTVWETDMWRCRKCGYCILTGFEQRGIAHHDEVFAALLRRVRERQPIEEGQEMTENMARNYANRIIEKLGHAIGMPLPLISQHEWEEHKRELNNLLDPSAAGFPAPGSVPSPATAAQTKTDSP